MPEQFGSPGNWDQPVGYLQRVLDEASRWVSSSIGATLYDAQTQGSAFGWIVSAEVYYANAVLFRRRITQVDAAAVAGLQSSVKVDPLKALRRQAEITLTNAQTCLANAMTELGLDASPSLPGTGMRSSTLVTGRYAEASCG